MRYQGYFVIATTLLLLSGCVKEEIPELPAVAITQQPPAKSCQYIKDIYADV